MALLMAEEIKKRNLSNKIRVKKIILGAERHSDAMRTRIQELMNVDDIFDIYGLTEVYGPGTGLDCKYHTGIHYWSDLFIYEIIDPETLKPVPPGTVGELVVTTLRKEASPLIRYRTHDMTRLLDQTCPCGAPYPQHDRILGRSDDMFTYRAVNIYPSQIDHILSRVAGIDSEYQIHLTHNEDGRDLMTIRAERQMGVGADDAPRLADAIAHEIRSKILVRCRVEIQPHGSLPRTERKSRRVFDHRK
jgi:phenylacetate-CoA ligase